MCLHLLTCGLACVAAYLQVENAAFDREAACAVPGMRGGFFFPDIFIVAELQNWQRPLAPFAGGGFTYTGLKIVTLLCCVLGAAPETLVYEALGRHGGEVTQFSALLVLIVWINS